MSDCKFTKKMANIIYKKWKEGRIYMSSFFINYMYDFAKVCEYNINNHNYMSEYVILMMNKFRDIVYYLCKFDYDKTQNMINSIAEEIR